MIFVMHRSMDGLRPHRGIGELRSHRGIGRIGHRGEMGCDKLKIIIWQSLDLKI